MIDFSFSTVLTAVLVSNLLLVLITLCFRKTNLLLDIGYKLLAVLCAVILLRLLIPLELPITKTVPLPRILSNVLIVFRRPYTIGGIEFSIWSLFCMVWFVGILVNTVWFWQELQKQKKNICTQYTDITSHEVCASIIREFCTEKQAKRLRVLTSSKCLIPSITGLRRPVILLPETDAPLDINGQYALRHEIYHYVHHDLWLKALINLLVIVYWWNPFSHQLYRHISATMEMRVDDSILTGDPDTDYDYLGSILFYARRTDRSIRLSRQFIGYFGDIKSTLYKRIQLAKNQDHKPNYRMGAALSAFIIGVYILSYLFIGEIYYVRPEIEDSCIATSSSDFYIIINNNNTYDIYYNDIYLETADTLDYYPLCQNIYSSEEDYHEKNP